MMTEIFSLRTLMMVLVTLSLVSLAHADDAKLRQAYQREFAFLQAEKNSLAGRVKELKDKQAAQIAEGRNAVDALQGRVLAYAAEADQMSESLLDAERAAEGSSDGADQLESTIAQMGAALEKGDVKMLEFKTEDKEASQKQISFGFEKGLELLREFSSVKKEKGSFFAADGREIKGDLIHLGRIASFGVSEKESGALAPAGDDRLKLWTTQSSAPTAKALAAGKVPSVLSLFLYESLDKGVEEKKDKTPIEVIESGGVIGWVIVVAGIIAMLLGLLRAFFLMKNSANTDRLVATIAPLVHRHQYAKAIEECIRARSAAGRVLKATLTHINRPREELEDIVSESVLHETPHLDRFGSTIMVIAAVAPLLGLLGTVTGMIATFDIITEFGTGNPKLLSGGISVALVTTELGLIVAIPALLLGNLLSAWAERIKDEMDRSALHITNISTGVRLSVAPFPQSSDDSGARPQSSPGDRSVAQSAPSLAPSL